MKTFQSMKSGNSVHGNHEKLGSESVAKSDVRAFNYGLTWHETRNSTYEQSSQLGMLPDCDNGSIDACENGALLYKYKISVQQRLNKV